MNPYGLANKVPGSQLFGMLPWQRRRKCERLAAVRWQREVYEELRAGELQFGGADWQHAQWCQHGPDVRARWVLGSVDVR